MVRAADSVAVGSMRTRLNPVGNARLTEVLGVLLLGPVAVELGTVLLGVHSFMSWHVFVGLALIPPVLLKLASTSWRFARYYTRQDAYLEHGAPQLAMRLLAPLFVLATVVLFSSGVAMGFVHGDALVVARRLHGPASVIWILLFAVHSLAYLRQALIGSSQEIIGARPSVPGRTGRGYLIATAVVSGLIIGALTVPVQHHWVRLPRDHHRSHSRAPHPSLSPS